MWLLDLYTYTKPREDAKIIIKKIIELILVKLINGSIWKSRMDRRALDSFLNYLQQIENGDKGWVLKWRKLRNNQAYRYHSTWNGGCLHICNVMDTLWKSK